MIIEFSPFIVDVGHVGTSYFVLLVECLGMKSPFGEKKRLTAKYG